jgi:hypothetical protein
VAGKRGDHAAGVEGGAGGGGVGLGHDGFLHRTTVETPACGAVVFRVGVGAGADFWRGAGAATAGSAS